VARPGAGAALTRIDSRDDCALSRASDRLPSAVSLYGIVPKLVDGPPPPLATVQPGVHADLLAIVAKAMSRSPDDRYPNGKELAEDLKRFQTGQLVGAHEYSRSTLVGRWLRR